MARNVGKRKVGNRTPGRAVHKGIIITRTPFGRWETRQLKFGDAPGEFFSFKSKKAAVAFINKATLEGDIGRLRGPQ